MFSRLIGLLSLLAIIVGALNTAEVLTLLPPKVGLAIAITAAVTSALSRALVDRDRNGIPDVLEGPDDEIIS